jgi:hypothetical protein
MTEMRTMATGANLSLKTLADAAKMSSEEFRLMGLSQGDGVKKLAKGMEAASRTIGKSGGSLRDEMLGLGYSYEEQGAIMAQYMAQQKASGALEKMTTEQIAKGTKDYAINLKVISDITGQDAKKLMEKARAESMRGALMSKLDAKQQESFKLAHSAMAGMGPEFQNALMQMLAGGTVTDPMIDRLVKLTTDCKAFTDDLRYFMIKEIVNGNKLKFSKLMMNNNVVKMAVK